MNTLITFAAQYLFLVSIASAAGLVSWYGPAERKRYLTLLATAGVIALILTKLAGALYFDPRPFVTHNFTPLIAHAADNGFPSDHTVLTTVIAGVVFMLNRRLGSALFVIALLVGITRAAAGIHTPLDISAGVIIGLISVTVGYFPARWFLQREKSS